MAFFRNLISGWNFCVQSINSLIRYPILIVPLVVAWFPVSGIILYVRFGLEPPDDLYIGVLYVFLSLLAISVLLFLANSVLLELIEQIESGESPSLTKAAGESFRLNLIHTIPLAISYAIIWTILVILQAIARKSDSSSNDDVSLEQAARTLGGGEGSTSTLSLSLEMIEKMVRMGFFMAMPVIAWEGKNWLSAISSSNEIFKKHLSVFFGAYSGTLLFSLIMGIPLFIAFTIDDHWVEFSPATWTVVLIYITLAWSLNLYFEQMSVALLYLWHKKWKEEGESKAIREIDRPSLLDDSYELA